MSVLRKTAIALLALLIILAVVVVAGMYIWNTMHVAPTSPAQSTTPPPSPIAHPFGVVTAKDANGFTISSVDNVSIVVHTSSQTKFVTGTTAKQYADLHIGSLVSISSSTPQTDGSLTADDIEIIPPPPAPQAQ